MKTFSINTDIATQIADQEMVSVFRQAEYLFAYF